MLLQTKFEPNLTERLMGINSNAPGKKYSRAFGSFEKSPRRDSGAENGAENHRSFKISYLVEPNLSILLNRMYRFVILCSLVRTKIVSLA